MVRSMGTSEIRQHPRLIFLRWQSHYLARTVQRLAKDLRGRPPYRICKPRRMGSPRGGLPSRLRIV